MLRFRFRFLILIAALAGGCTTAAVSYDLSSRYIGVHADDFFFRWGAPVSSKTYKDGGRLYLWFSGRDSAHKPGYKGTVDLIGNTAWWRGYTIENYRPQLECRIEILAAPSGVIIDIRAYKDNKAWWDIMRCREVFGTASHPRR